jgi:hypothetical protein
MKEKKLNTLSKYDITMISIIKAHKIWLENLKGWDHTGGLGLTG